MQFQSVKISSVVLPLFGVSSYKETVGEAVIETRRTRGSTEQDRENNDGYSRVNELSEPDNQR